MRSISTSSCRSFLHRNTIRRSGSCPWWRVISRSCVSPSGSSLPVPWIMEVGHTEWLLIGLLVWRRRPHRRGRAGVSRLRCPMPCDWMRRTTRSTLSLASSRSGFPSRTVSGSLSPTSTSIKGRGSVSAPLMQMIRVRSQQHFWQIGTSPPHPTSGL